MEENLIQTYGEITINVHVSAGDIIYVKKIIFEILLYAVAKMVNI